MTLEKIYRIVSIFIIALLLVFSVIQKYRISRYEQQLGQYRETAKQFGEYKQRVAESIQSASECIISARGSVYELREGMRELQKIFEDMENYCNSYCFNADNRNSSRDSEVE